MTIDGFREIYTQSDWQSSTSPDELIRLMDGMDHPARLWQLYACSCCWRILPLLDERSRFALTIAQRQAEGWASPQEVEEARHIAHTAVLTIWRPGLDSSLAFAAMAAQYALVNPRRAAYFAAKAAGGGEVHERQAQSVILRDIFDSPFQKVAIDPGWLTPNVLNIAEDIYENETYPEIPVLADALEESGCADPTVLAHARATVPHVRGCWLLDRLLGLRR